MINETLRRLADVPWERRTCSFTTTVALLVSPDKIQCVDGRHSGFIALEPSAKRIASFPFRSLFFVPEVGKIVAELPPAVQSDFMSHRKQAIMKLIPYLKQI